MKYLEMVFGALLAALLVFVLCLVLSSCAPMNMGERMFKERLGHGWNKYSSSKNRNNPTNPYCQHNRGK